MEQIEWTADKLARLGFDVPTILNRLGCKDVKSTGDRWTARSPFREDRHPSFWMYKDTLVWQDPAEGLQGGIDYLCRKITGMSLQKFLDVDLNQLRNNAFLPKKKEPQKIRSFIRTASYDPKDFEICVVGSGLNYNIYEIPEALEYARSRFMNDEFIDFFHVGYCKDSLIFLKKKGENPSEDTPKTRYYKRLIIPIIEQGSIASIEGRDITRHQQRKCVYPASYEGNLGGSSYRRLFNIDNLDPSQPLIICEGVMDTVRIWQYITKNVTCTYGSSIKKKQEEDILKFKDVIVFSDSDSGGLVTMRDMDRFYPRDFRVAQLPSGDPGDEINTVDMLKKAIDEAISFPRWLMNFTEK